MRQIRLKNQAIAGIQQISLATDNVSDMAFNAINKFPTGMHDGILAAICAGIQRDDQRLRAEVGHPGCQIFHDPMLK